jgi:hypothetical protein
MQGGLRSNHRGIGGDCLWLAARVAQYRCESEWTHLSCRMQCVHSDHRQSAHRVPVATEPARRTEATFAPGIGLHSDHRQGR